MKIRSLILFTALMTASQNAQADWVMLKNGDRLSGTITQQSGTSVSINTNSMGVITLPTDKIASVHQGPAPRILARELRTGIPMSYVAPAANPDATTNSDQVRQTEEAKPPATKDEREVGVYKWSGRASLGGTLETGNNEASNVVADIEAKVRDKNNRFKLGAEANYGTEDGERTDNDQQAYGEYDRFITEKWFIGGRQDFERDEFEELDLRSKTGAFAGYQFYEQDDLNLSVKSGPTYIYEKFENGDTESDIALGWLLDYDQKFMDDKLQLFHNHEIQTPFADTGAFLFESATGARVPIGEKLDASAQIDFDWDNDPAEGVQEDDTTYSLKLGYGW